jgi:hypothetical protein
MSAKSSIVRTTIARLSIGLVLGLVLGVVLHQSNTRTPLLYTNLLSQGAFGAFESQKFDSSMSVDCTVVDDLNATACCIDVGPPYSPACCAYNPSWCSSSSSSWCSGDTDGDGDCDDDPAHVCCDGVCQLPDMCSSSSSSAQQYCCAFDGTGCIAAPGNDPGNDACDQNNTGFDTDTCNDACASSSSSQQWCCQHVLPAGPANCSAL